MRSASERPTRPHRCPRSLSAKEVVPRFAGTAYFSSALRPFRSGNHRLNGDVTRGYRFDRARLHDLASRYLAEDRAQEAEQKSCYAYVQSDGPTANTRDLPF